MRLIELFESRSADLYHGTNMLNAAHMLQDNALIAKTPIHNKIIPNEFKGLKRTVSLSRSSDMATNFARSSSGGEEGVKGIPVVIVLDQEKLYRKLGRRMRPYNDLDSLPGGTERSRGGGEYEEAVFGSIGDISSYIKKIVVHMRPGQKKESFKDLNKVKIVFDDPRTIVVDYLNKNLTGRQFLDLIKSNSTQSTTIQPNT